MTKYRLLLALCFALAFLSGLTLGCDDDDGEEEMDASPDTDADTDMDVDGGTYPDVDASTGATFPFP